MPYKTFTGESIQEAVNAAKLEFGRDFQLVSQEKKVHRTGLFGLFGKKEFYQVVVSYTEGQTAHSSAQTNERERQEVLERIARIMSERKNRQADFAAPAEASGAQSAQNMLAQALAQGAPALQPGPGAARSVVDEIADLKEMLGPILRGEVASGTGARHEGFPRVRAFLEKNDFGRDFIERTLEHLGSRLTYRQARDEEVVREHLESWLHDAVKTSPPDLDIEHGPRMIALVGPTGVGKTTTLAKIGAELALTRGKRVAFVTMDDYRLGAREQIGTYAEIMRSSLHMVRAREELERIVKDGKYDYYLLDTTGHNQKKEMQIGEIRRALGVVKIPVDVHLVVSATTKYCDLVEIMKNFAPLRYERVIATKLDETNTFGSLVSALSESEKALTWVCMGQDVPDDIKAAEPQDCVGRIMMHYRAEEALVQV